MPKRPESRPEATWSDGVGELNSDATRSSSCPPFFLLQKVRSELPVRTGDRRCQGRWDIPLRRTRLAGSSQAEENGMKTGETAQV